MENFTVVLKRESFRNYSIEAETAEAAEEKAWEELRREDSDTKGDANWVLEECVADGDCAKPVDAYDDATKAAIEKLRDAGYLVVIWTPGELRGVQPHHIENLVIERGNNAIEMLGDEQGPTYVVETEMANGLWENCWSEDDVPLTFKSIEEAQAAIDEHVQSATAAGMDVSQLRITEVVAE